MPTFLKMVDKTNLAEEYDALCQLANNIIKRHNPCNIKVVDGKVTCFGGDGCCQGCQHLTPKGCAESSLSCKLWLCRAIYTSDRPHHRAVVKELGKLQQHVHFNTEFRGVERGSRKAHLKAVPDMSIELQL